MGIIKRGILGGFSGKVANVVGGEWKGISYMRSLPLSVANPRTAGQVSQRNKFSGAVAMASEILAGIVKPLWDRFAQQQSGYNAFISANIEAFDTNGTPFPANLIFGRGSLEPVSNLGISNAGGNNIQLSWSDNSGTGNALANDVAYGIILSASGVVKGTASGEPRNSEAIEVPCNAALESGDFGYLVFRRSDGTLVSDSKFIVSV